MKKLLGIVVLGLLLSTNVYAAKVKIYSKKTAGLFNEPFYKIFQEKRPLREYLMIPFTKYSKRNI